MGWDKGEERGGDYMVGIMHLSRRVCGVLVLVLVCVYVALSQVRC
jgi:hypothetical protein